MIPTLTNGFYVATNARNGAWSVGTQPPSLEQETNANIIRSFFINEGWTLEAICGMLGCMQGESTINPAYIQATNRYRLPNSADDLTDVPNSVAKDFFYKFYNDDRRAYGMGLVQWDGYTVVSQSPLTEYQKMVAFAIANNIIWYDGWTQLYRLRYEWNYDVNNNSTIFFYPVRYSGVTYTFSNFPTATATPETLAAAWTSGYERNAGGVGYRAENARWWYNYFTGASAPAIIPQSDFLSPLQADPILPPFDPDHPVDPGIPTGQSIPPWLSTLIRTKRGVLFKWKRA